jgi:hypothetical protein
MNGFQIFTPPNPYEPGDPRHSQATAGAVAHGVMALFIIINSIMAGVAAIVGGPLLFAFRKISRWDLSLSVWQCWKATFLGYFAYFAVATLLNMG